MSEEGLEKKRPKRIPTHPGAILKRMWWMNLQTNRDVWEAEEKAGVA